MKIDPLKVYADLVAAEKPLGKIIAALVATAVIARPAIAQSITPDPSGSSVISNAVNWLTGTLLGNVATGVAVLAVAIIAILLMTGRIEWGRAALVVIGIFVLFGAATIVTGIRSITGTGA